MNDFDNKQICSYKDIDRFGFTCDVCGRKVNGCHYINGMKFCAKCYQETFGKDNQQNEIQQLKQLAEKDKEIERLNHKLNVEETCLTRNYKDMLEQLKQSQTQLAIQELERLKASADKWFEFWENSKYEGNIYDKLDVSNAYLQMSCEIDQQIKLLKGEHDE